MVQHRDGEENEAPAIEVEAPDDVAPRRGFGPIARDLGIDEPDTPVVDEGGQQVQQDADPGVRGAAKRHTFAS